MDYPVKTPQQLRPLLVGFRKAAGLTQAHVAARLGVTQQTYAQLEAKPESASLDRLYHVLKLLNVNLVLTQASGPARLGRVRVSEHPTALKVAPKKSGPAAKAEIKGGANPKLARERLGRAGVAPSPTAMKGAPKMSAPPAKAAVKGGATPKLAGTKKSAKPAIGSMSSKREDW